MKNKVTCFFCSVLLFLTGFSSAQNSNGATKDELMEWFRAAKFGMFIHFGASTSEDYLEEGLNKTERYEKSVRDFNPVDLDAKEWVRIAKDAGMKYIVFTTKHHSGFCMWDTQTTDFKITNTPYGKDLLKEYVDGVRRAGLAVGFYYSPEDFKFLYENNINVRRHGLNLDDTFMVKYMDFIRQQTNELFSNYGKVDVLFIDGNPKESCKDEAWNLQADLVITRGAVSTPEQTIPGVASDNLWESCVTMGTQWQYKPTNDELKSANKIIEMLIETRAKGGNLLLNIGLDPFGVMPDPEARNLTEVAAWQFINHEAIEKVRPWIVTHEDNIWFTASKDRNTVYAIITGVPEWTRGERKEFILRSVRTTPDTKISVLGQNDKVVEYNPDVDPRSRFKQTENGLNISVVRAQRIYNNHKWHNPITVKLENVEPALDPPIIITKNADVSGEVVCLNGELFKKGSINTIKVGFEYRPYAGFVENLYSTSWEKSTFIMISKEKGFSIEIDNMDAETIYEYRAVVEHPMMRIYGDIKQLKTGKLKKLDARD